MGHVHIIRDFHSPQEGFTRTVRIYTPDAYDFAAPGHRFPVLYMHDGQNVFAHPASAVFDTWCANLALERLVAEGRVEPWLIVAVDHTHDRLAEYSPWDEPRSNVPARAAPYVRFLVETLKPYIEYSNDRLCLCVDRLSETSDRGGSGHKKRRQYARDHRRTPSSEKTERISKPSK